MEWLVGVRIFSYFFDHLGHDFHLLGIFLDQLPECSVEVLSD
jgi:hypothetical protein